MNHLIQLYKKFLQEHDYYCEFSSLAKDASDIYKC